MWATRGFHWHTAVFLWTSLSLTFGLMTSALAEEMALWWVVWKGIFVYVTFYLRWRNLLQDFLSEKNSPITCLNARKYQLGAEFWKGRGVPNILWFCHVCFPPSALVSMRDENQTLQNALFNPDISQGLTNEQWLHLVPPEWEKEKKMASYPICSWEQWGKQDKRPGRDGDWAWESLTLSTLPNSWASHPPPLWLETGEQEFR